MPMPGQDRAELLSAQHVRSLAQRLGVSPTKAWGQNFVIDPNTVRRIVRTADVRPTDHVLEVGPGLGSLTLGLLPAAASVTALEIDARLAAALPETVAAHAPALVDRLRVLHADALRAEEFADPQPNVLVANLPYNVAVPVVLHLLASVPTLHSVLVMVQLEVAQRLAADPGSKVYGVPSVKAAWYAQVSL
ncbi:MAG: rRNA adenine dimethyltransferase family protein, partial [Ornithinimicrobium sp.]